MTKIEMIVKKLKKDHGDDAAEVGYDRECGVLRTGMLSLDVALGGGWPLGRMCEFYGREGSGKSTLAMVLAAAFQRGGFTVYHFDVERSFDPARAEVFGVDVGALVTSDLSVAERLGDLIYDILQTDQEKLIIVDSTAAVSSAKELESDIGPRSFPFMASFWSKATRVWHTEMGRKWNNVLLVNQSRANLGPSSMDLQPGGRQMKHLASVRLEVVRGGWIGKSPDWIGHEVKIRAIKSKVGPPLRWGVVDLYFDGRGFDREKDVVTVAKASGALSTAGGWVKVRDTKMRSTEYRHLLSTDPEMLEELEAKAYGALFPAEGEGS